MRYFSARCISTDPFRAGLEIGQALAPFAPEVILIFASVSYQNSFADFFDALYGALNNESVIIFGGTGDGIYERSGAENYGISALAMSSDATVTWKTAIAQGVGADSEAAARACAQSLGEIQAGTKPFCMALADGTRADGQGIVTGISSVLTIPYFGGLTGDDRKFTRSKIFLNGKQYDDAVVMLLGTGNLRFAVDAASGWTPRGTVGVVEDTLGKQIRRISGQTAQSFMATELGKPPNEADVGVVPLAAYQGSSEHFFLRAPSQLHPDSGAVSTFGSVKQGTSVRVCTATKNDVLHAIETLGENLKHNIGFRPQACILVSCAGRKWLLADKGEKELSMFFSTLGHFLPLAGFPSFGEISPFLQNGGTYSEVGFHNQTVVCCLLG